MASAAKGVKGERRRGREKEGRRVGWR